MSKIAESSAYHALFTGDEDSPPAFKQMVQVAALVSSLSSNVKVNKAATSLGLAITVGSVLSSTYKRYQNAKLRDEKRYFIDISEGPAYDQIVKMISHKVDAEDIETLQLSVNWHGKRTSRTKAEVVQTYDAKLDVALEIAGHMVRVRTPKPSDGNVVGSGAGDTYIDQTARNSSKSKVALYMACESSEARTDVIKEIERMVLKAAEPEPSFYVTARWNGFDRVSEIPTRPRESVILKEGQMDRILDYLRSFLEQEEHYVNLGIPYRTGVLLSGAPGSGKSSTASAIAFELGLDVYFVSLSSVKDDDALVSIMEDLPPRSILILEDIDIAKSTKDRKDSGEGGVTMSGLLNCLDGFTSPHGVITLMTTNYRDSMDSAVIRPGRVDLEETIDYLDDYQLRGICEYFMGSVPEGLPTVDVSHEITSAAVVGVLKKYIPNVAEAADEIVQFVSEKTKVFTK